jgi:hypothetical protein
VLLEPPPPTLPADNLTQHGEPIRQ